jgi:hypothetical protein
MKSNLTLKKFSTNSVPGTMNQNELRTFFGSKIIYSENVINIDDDSINYSHVVGDYNNGYQYFDRSTIPDDWEVDFSENLTDLKNNYHTISLLSQTSENMLINTRWQININASSILTNYLYFKLKQQRVFKMINANELYSNNINTSVYEYVKNNLFSRYRLVDVKFYIQYYDIKEQQSLKKNILLQYNPKFNVDVYSDVNYTKLSSNYDSYKFDSVILQYNQTKPSNQYSFDYYFDLVFSKI